MLEIYPFDMDNIEKGKLYYSALEKVEVLSEIFGIINLYKKMKKQNEVQNVETVDSGENLSTEKTENGDDNLNADSELKNEAAEKIIVDDTSVNADSDKQVKSKSRSGK